MNAVSAVSRPHPVAQTATRARATRRAYLGGAVAGAAVLAACAGRDPAGTRSAAPVALGYVAALPATNPEARGLAGRARGLECAAGAGHGAPGGRAGRHGQHQAQGAARRRDRPRPDDGRVPAATRPTSTPWGRSSTSTPSQVRAGLGPAARRHLSRLPREQPVGGQAGGHPRARHLPGHDLQPRPAPEGRGGPAQGALDVDGLPTPPARRWPRRTCGASTSTGRTSSGRCGSASPAPPP